MSVREPFLCAAILLTTALAGFGQTALPVAGSGSVQAPSLSSGVAAPQSVSVPTADGLLPSPAARLQLDFRDSDIKFGLQRFMSILRDQRHEGWVLAAYPDPKTSRPLIGAGFSLDVPEREHPQRDPLNPHTFVEPSSAQLWQAAGLDPARLQSILERFDRDLKAWTKTRYRRRIRSHALAPDVTEDEANALLRISAIQAIHNARAYCRGFDALTGPQQMALSQLVFQMGVNLEEFTQFLDVLNGNAASGGVSQGNEHWQTVQRALIESQWARRYTGRATTVIAMFDPEYGSDPGVAERRVEAVLRPPARHRRRGRSARTVLVASYSRHAGKMHGRRAQSKRRLS